MLGFRAFHYTTFFTFISSILFCHILSSFFFSSHLFFFLHFLQIIGPFGQESKIQCRTTFFIFISFHSLLSHLVFFLLFFTSFLLSTLPLNHRRFQTKIHNLNNVPKNSTTIYTIDHSIEIMKHLFVYRGEFIIFSFLLIFSTFFIFCFVKSSSFS